MTVIEQLFIIYSRLKRLSLTTLIIARLIEGYLDSYEPGTQRERGYIYVTNGRLIASDSSIEGNRRDYNMSGNQTSGKEGGVQGVMMVVCLYVCMYA